MINDYDNEMHAAYHRPQVIRSTDRPLSEEDRALLTTPEARALAEKYPGWGPLRIKARLSRSSERNTS